MAVPLPVASQHVPSQPPWHAVSFFSRPSCKETPLFSRLDLIALPMLLPCCFVSLAQNRKQRGVQLPPRPASAKIEVCGQG